MRPIEELSEAVRRSAHRAAHILVRVSLPRAARPESGAADPVAHLRASIAAGSDAFRVARRESGPGVIPPSKA